MRIRVGTRGSQLALWQANEVARKLTEAGHEPELVIVKTTGDKRQDVSLASIGGKGLFIKELEDALDRAEIDLAVHSLKDVPSLIPNRFVLAGFLERADPRDAWLHVGHVPIEAMPPGSTIGTSAPRRRAQLLARFPQLRVEPMRGNVDSRLGKLRDGLFAGAVLASAGLHRLGRHEEITSLFDVDQMVPAAGQGIVGFETLATNADAIRACEAIGDARSATAARCERGVLQQFGEQLDCWSAVAVHATVGDELTVRAFFADLDGDRAIRITRTARDADSAVRDVYEELVANGAKELLRAR